MAVGQFDQSLFLRMRSAKGETRRLLLGRLLIENEPLVKTLVGQLLGKREYRRPGARVARCPGTESDGRIPGADILEWEDALQSGRIGMAKALESLDLEKGKLSYHALRNIHYQLQVLMGSTAVVKVERGREGDVKGVLASSYEDDDGGTGFFEAMTHQHVQQERGEAFDHGDFAIAKVQAERDQAKAEADRARPPENGVQCFVAQKLVFGDQCRIAAMVLRSVYERFVSDGRYFFGGTLSDAIKERGARYMKVRVREFARPVWGFKGVTVRTAIV